MNNILKNLFALVVVSLLMAGTLSAQTVVTRTTLAAAMPAGARQINVASATGITAQTNTQQNYVLIEQDLRQVLNVTGTIVTLSPSRGAAVGHVNGATVVFGTPGNWNTGTAGTTAGSTGVFMASAPPQGACLRANMQFTPVFVVNDTKAIYGMADCLGGKWVLGTLPDAPDARALILASNIPIGSLAYSSAVYTQTIAGGTTVEFLTSIMVPQSGWVTGIKFLCGSTCTTDNALAILRDSTGTVIANAATAGVVLSGASTFQTQAFTAKQFVVGPAKYFIGIQFNGNTAADMAAIATSTWPDVVTGQLTSGTFGTIVNPATMPTTFTAGQGPIAFIYY